MLMMMKMKRTVMKTKLTTLFIVTKYTVTQQDRDDEDDDDKDNNNDNDDDNDDDDDEKTRNENDLDNCFHSNQIYSNPAGQRR